jgi:hypothetical protein
MAGKCPKFFFPGITVKLKNGGRKNPKVFK